jgi:hypothetical protein
MGQAMGSSFKLSFVHGINFTFKTSPAITLLEALIAFLFKNNRISKSAAVKTVKEI